MTTQGLQILIVDDNSMNRKLVSMLLKSMGCVVQEAGGGIDCLEMITQQKYDIIFMDQLMPGMDGVETLNRMKELATSLNKKTPVIALTADDMGNGKSYYLQFGFDDYLVKPVVPQQLQELIEKL